VTADGLGRGWKLEFCQGARNLNMEETGSHLKIRIFHAKKCFFNYLKFDDVRRILSLTRFFSHRAALRATSLLSCEQQKLLLIYKFLLNQSKSVYFVLKLK
jgi:hypothetical protein